MAKILTTKKLGMKKSKLFILINSFEMGGAERVVSQIASALNKTFSVEIVVLKQGVFYESDVPIRYLSKTRSNLSMFLQFPKYVLAVKQLAKEGVVLSFLDYSNFINILANHFALISVRNHIAQYEGIKGLLYKIGMRLLHPFAWHIVVNSQENLEDLSEFLRVPKDKLSVIYNPIDAHAVKQRSQQKDSDLEKIFGKPTFVTACRFVGFKQVDVVLRAFELFVKDNPKNATAQLVLVGDGPKKTSLEAYAKKKNLLKNVLFVGAKKNVFPFFARADCIVFGSRAEGYPNALLEPMVLGKPLITTHFKSGSTEVIFGKYIKQISCPQIGPNGILVDLKKPVQSLFEGMKQWQDLKQKQAGISQYNPTFVANQWKEAIQKISDIQKNN